MKKVNFKQFGLYEDIAKRSRKTVDVSEVFANIIYQRVPGIRAHELAMRIYRDGEVAVGSEDEQIILQVANQFCTPAFIDGLGEQLNTEEEG
jgi:hypothetical protein